jgi:phosphosulfolactate synthase (CoM biosynthesis protein A)
MARHLLEDLWNNDRSYYARFWNIVDKDFKNMLEEGWEIEWQKLGVDIIHRNDGAVMMVGEKRCFVVEIIGYARYLIYTEMSRRQQEQRRS